LRDRTTHTGAQAISTVTSLQTSLDAGLIRRPALSQESANPVLVNAAETSLVMSTDGTRCDCWYRSVVGGDTTNIYYASATDSACKTFVVGNSGNPILTGYRYVLVFTVSGTNYLMAVKASDGNLYLWSIAANGVTLTALNSGSPVLTHSSDTSKWYNQLFNPAIAVVGSTLHLLIEGKNGTGGQFETGYSHATLAAPNFNTNLSAASVFANTGNPFLLYLPNRSRLLMLIGDISSGIWKIKAYTANPSSDLSDIGNWTASTWPALQQNNIHVADVSLVEAGRAKDHNLIVHLGYNQLDVHAFYSELTLDQWYDTLFALPDYGEVILDADFTFSGASNSTYTSVLKADSSPLQITLPSAGAWDVDVRVFANTTSGAQYVETLCRLIASTGGVIPNSEFKVGIQNVSDVDDYRATSLRQIVNTLVPTTLTMQMMHTGAGNFSVTHIETRMSFRRIH
jgi:hypothetical protein